MADVRVTWTPTPTNFPEGTAPGPYRYTVHLGAMVAAAPAGATMQVFPDVAPGDYPSSVDTLAADGTVLATHQGNVLHVPTPVSVPVAMQVQASLV